jgi:hypothetical protein
MRAHKDTIESSGAAGAAASALTPEQLAVVQTRARAAAALAREVLAHRGRPAGTDPIAD